jgi:hypothetical protein
MVVASLGVSSPAWRAARAAANIGSLLRGETPADDALAALSSLGEAPGGWWHTFGDARRAGGVTLLLPRFGDPRGLVLPRDMRAEAALGWDGALGGTWLIPSDGLGWRVASAPSLGRTPPDEEEASRALRAAVVDAAHTVDLLDVVEHGANAEARQDLERAVDSWVLGPPPLSPASRHLASLGLRILVALDSARNLVDTGPLESAARDAVESAFTTASTAR